MYFECVWLLYRRLFDCFSVIWNKTFYQGYTLFSHTPHHTKSALGSRGRDIFGVVDRIISGIFPDRIFNKEGLYPCSIPLVDLIACDLSVPIFTDVCVCLSDTVYVLYVFV